jgi:hypothetical protein
VFKLTMLQRELETLLSRIPGTVQYVGSDLSGIGGVEKQHNFITFVAQYNQFVKQFQVSINMHPFQSVIPIKQYLFLYLLSLPTLASLVHIWVPSFGP